MAAFANLSKVALSAPGTFAETSRWLFVDGPTPVSFFQTDRRFGRDLVRGQPRLVSCAESAMAKHPACAAAINSSGLVPTPFSNRVENEYCVLASTPLAVEMRPLPPFKYHSKSRTLFFAFNFLPGTILKVMRVVIASDHAGFELKNALAGHIRQLGHEVQDAGTYTNDPVDYPDYAEALAKPLLTGAADRGVS